MHHIASDGWSMGILVREVAALYAAFAAGRPSPLPELPVQYADFAVWQSSWLQGEVLEREIAYWRQQLAGLPPLLELPTDRPRPAVQSFRGATRPVRLPAGLTGQMEALARREGATLFMVLLAGFQALLARTSGQEDLAVGSPIAGRNRVEIEGLIGFFVNTLVLRGDLSGDRPEALVPRAARPGAGDGARGLRAPGRAVRKAGRGAGAGEEPRALASVPGDARAAERSRRRAWRSGTCACGRWTSTATTAKFDLTLSLEEHDGELAGIARVRHRPVRRHDDRPPGRAFRAPARGGGLATPDEPASALPLLSPAERAQILVEWNDTAADRGIACSPASPASHELFAAPGPADAGGRRRGLRGARS